MKRNTGLPEVELGKVQVYYSSNSHGHSHDWYNEELPIEHAIARQPDIDFQPWPLTKDIGEEVLECPRPISDIKSVRKDHIMRGVGTGLDGAFVRHYTSMTAEQQREYLTTLLNPEDGVGFTQFRLVIGTSDFNFTRGDLYSYYDKVPEGEPDWDNDFSIQPDIDMGLIDIIKEIQALATEFGIIDQLTFLASPWSPPGWMKVNADLEANELGLIGGQLSEDHLEHLAIYLRRYVEEYAKLDIPIHALTIQNEPIIETPSYPSCQMTGQKQGHVARYLRNEFANSSIIQEKGYYTELWAWDFICDWGLVNIFLDHVEEVDPGLSLFDGIAFHSYHAFAVEIRNLSERFPNLTMNVTEAMESGILNFTRAIQLLRVNCTSYYSWCTCLAPDRQPNEWTYIWPWETLSTYNGERYWFWPTKNLLGQVSRFARPGCIKLDSSASIPIGVEHVFYQDPVNNNIILIYVNAQYWPHTVLRQSQITGEVFYDSIPAQTMATYIYNVRS